MSRHHRGDDIQVAVAGLASTYLLSLQRLAPERGEDAVRPVVGGHVQSAKHLWGRDGLWVHPHLAVGLAAVRHGLHEHVNAAGLAGTRRTEGHHAVPYSLGLKQLKGPNG